MHPTLHIMIRAARKAGKIIMQGAQEATQVQIKHHNEFVTEVDKRSEQAIIETLREAFPHYGVLAEESGETNAQASRRWIIDPLDGTTNFIHGIPHFAVSIALEEHGRLTQAVIYDPSRNDLYQASRGHGALVNDRRLRVSKHQGLAGALIGTGLPYSNFARFDEYLHILREVAKETAGIRRPGAASLDLAWMAAGLYDGFWEFGLAPWDIAAGVLLVIEAGGIVTDFDGQADYLTSGDIIAATPKVFKPLMDIVVRHTGRDKQKSVF